MIQNFNLDACVGNTIIAGMAVGAFMFTASTVSELACNHLPKHALIEQSVCQFPGINV